jgi:hypothetical protein
MTSTSTTKSTTKVDILDATQKFGEQWVSAVKQSQSIAVDVARAFAHAVPPAPLRLSEARSAVDLPDVSALTAYGFDLATQLLAAQTDFAVTLAGMFAPEKAAPEKTAPEKTA